MADNETIADIIAEIRALSNPISDGIIAINGKSIADRLEAAWKREKTAIEADALTVGGMVEAARKRERGDCAKLREALASILGIADHLQTRFAIPKLVNQGISELKQIAEAALAAPARNCDIAQDWLRDLYVKFKPPASIKREMPPEWVDSVMVFCRWLVAPATEKEGANYGNE